MDIISKNQKKKKLSHGRIRTILRVPEALDPDVAGKSREKVIEYILNQKKDEDDIPYSQTPEKHGCVQSLAAEARVTTAEIRIKEWKTIFWRKSQRVGVSKKKGWQRL